MQTVSGNIFLHEGNFTVIKIKKKLGINALQKNQIINFNLRFAAREVTIFAQVQKIFIVRFFFDVENATQIFFAVDNKSVGADELRRMVDGDVVIKIYGQSLPNDNVSRTLQIIGLRLKIYVPKSIFKALIIIGSKIIYQQGSFRAAITQNRLNQKFFVQAIGDGGNNFFTACNFLQLIHRHFFQVVLVIFFLFHSRPTSKQQQFARRW